MSDKFLLVHGSGGRLMWSLIENLIVKTFKNPILEKLDDSGVFCLNDLKIAYTTDSYVVDPIFFSGGDIGKLAVCGTVNDLLMVGARPLYMTASFIIEEGFSMRDFERILLSMSTAAQEVGIEIITGDTKVVNKGKADKIFITTSALGIVRPDINLSAHNAKVGDVVIISGYIGDHGICVLCEREGLCSGGVIESDVAQLTQLVQNMLTLGGAVHVLRDPTRGGLAATLNEICKQSNVGIILYEKDIPIREQVRGVCELLGFDPLYVANEGKLVAIVEEGAADDMLNIMRNSRYGEHAQIIGRVVAEPAGRVLLETVIGGLRIIDMPTGEQLPRIC